MNIAIKRRPSGILTHVVLILLAVVFVYPIVWLLMSSLKTNTELFTSPWSFPANPQFQNYVISWTTGIGNYIVNSVVVTSFTLVFILAFSSMAAYGVQRMKWKLSGPVMMFFLMGMMVPIHATLIPLYINFSKVGLLDSYVSLILPYVTFALPSTILILSGFFSTIPREMEEAAVIDGSSILRAFVQIILPISQPALITVMIFNFIGTWNELLVAVIFISNADRYTLPVGLKNFVGLYSTNYAPMLAATSLAVLPTIIIYSIFNTQIVAGITAGAIKG